MTISPEIVRPATPADPVSTTLTPWRFLHAVNAWLVLALMALAAIIRLFGMSKAFDFNSDEVDYTDLSTSIRHGAFPPQFDHGPFVLHPPLYFFMTALWDDILPTARTYLGLITQARELNVLCAALSTGLIFYLGTMLAGRGAGIAAALLFIFDPFLQQINNSALLETSTVMFVLAGWAILIGLFRDNVRRPTAVAVVGGLVVGLSVVTKDIAIALIVPPLLVAIWRRWADRRTLWLATICTLVPTAVYVIALTVVGSLGLWVSQETDGLQRLLGIKKVTGFSQGGHPSLVSTLIRQIAIYGMSYVVCGLGVLAALYLLRKCDRPDIRGLATITMAGALVLVYATLFGTIETQMFYFPAIPALISLPVAVVIYGRSLDSGTTRNLRRTLVGLLTVVLIYNGAVWVHVHTTTDNGMERIVTWFQTNEPSPGIIASDTDVAQLVLTRYGYDDVYAGSPELARSQRVRFITIMSVSVKGKYGTLTSSQAAWYEAHGTLVYRFNEPSYGQVSIYRTDNLALW